MAVIRKDLEKEKALVRIESALDTIRNYRKCIDFLKDDAEISVTVKPAGGKRGARVDTGMENDAARLSAIMTGAVKRMSKTVKRDAAKFDIELSEDERASMCFDENEAEPAPDQAAETEAGTDEAEETVATSPEDEPAAVAAEPDEAQGETSDWPDFEEDNGQQPEHQGKRFFGF